MSVWSRSHNDLARLAKFIQERNAQTRQGLADRGRVSTKHVSNPDLQSSSIDDEDAPATGNTNGGFDGTELHIDDSAKPQSPATHVTLPVLSDPDLLVISTPLFRGRGESFSSADSAISPDFHGRSFSPPTPILKWKARQVKNFSLALGDHVANSSDEEAVTLGSPNKKVTFQIQVSRHDEAQDFETKWNDASTTHATLTNGHVGRVEVNNDFDFGLSSTDQNNAHKISTSGGIERKDLPQTISPSSDKVAEENKALTKESVARIHHNEVITNGNLENYVKPPAIIGLPSSENLIESEKLPCGNNGDVANGTHEDSANASLCSNILATDSPDAISSVEENNEKPSIQLNLSNELNMLLISVLADYKKRQQVTDEKTSCQDDEDSGFGEAVLGSQIPSMNTHIPAKSCVTITPSEAAEQGVIGIPQHEDDCHGDTNSALESDIGSNNKDEPESNISVNEQLNNNLCLPVSFADEKKSGVLENMETAESDTCVSAIDQSVQEEPHESSRDDTPVSLVTSSEQPSIPRSSDHLLDDRQIPNDKPQDDGQITNHKTQPSVIFQYDSSKTNDEPLSSCEYHNYLPPETLAVNSDISAISTAMRSNPLQVCGCSVSVQNISIFMASSTSPSCQTTHSVRPQIEKVAVDTPVGEESVKQPCLAPLHSEKHPSQEAVVTKAQKYEAGAPLQVTAFRTSTSRCGSCSYPPRSSYSWRSRYSDVQPSFERFDSHLSFPGASYFQRSPVACTALTFVSGLRVSATASFLSRSQTTIPFSYRGRLTTPISVSMSTPLYHTVSAQGLANTPYTSSASFNHGAIKQPWDSNTYICSNEPQLPSFESLSPRFEKHDRPSSQLSSILSIYPDSDTLTAETLESNPNHISTQADVSTAHSIGDMYKYSSNLSANVQQLTKERPSFTCKTSKETQLCHKCLSEDTDIQGDDTPKASETGHLFTYSKTNNECYAETMYSDPVNSLKWQPFFGKMKVSTFPTEYEHGHFSFSEEDKTIYTNEGPTSGSSQNKKLILVNDQIDPTKIDATMADCGTSHNFKTEEMHNLNHPGFNGDGDSLTCKIWSDQKTASPVFEKSPLESKYSSEDLSGSVVDDINLMSSSLKAADTPKKIGPESKKFQARLERINYNVTRFLHSLFPSTPKEENGAKYSDSHGNGVHISDGLSFTDQTLLNSQQNPPTGAHENYPMMSNGPAGHTNHFRPVSPARSSISTTDTVVSDATSMALVEVFNTVKLLEGDNHAIKNQTGVSRKRKVHLTRSQLKAILSRLVATQKLLDSNYTTPELRSVRDDLHKLSSSLTRQLNQNKASLENDIRLRNDVFRPSPTKQEIASSQNKDDGKAGRTRRTKGRMCDNATRTRTCIKPNCLKVSSDSSFKSFLHGGKKGHAKTYVNLPKTCSENSKGFLCHCVDTSSRNLNITSSSLDTDSRGVKITPTSSLNFENDSTKRKVDVEPMSSSNEDLRLVEAQTETVSERGRQRDFHKNQGNLGKAQYNGTKVSQTLFMPVETYRHTSPFKEMYKFMCEEIESDLCVCDPIDIPVKVETPVDVNDSRFRAVQGIENEKSQLHATDGSTVREELSHAPDDQNERSALPFCDIGQPNTEPQTLSEGLIDPPVCQRPQPLSQRDLNLQEIDAQNLYQEFQRIEETGKNRQETGEERIESDNCSGASMESDSEVTYRLDREFDKHLADMKPFVLKLPQKTERQKSAVWIKKLCEPAGSSVTSRQNRNMYAKLMLHMLKKGSLHSPFDHKPSEGPLQPLPSYMSIYFDDPLADSSSKAEHVPDWVEGELGESYGSSGLPRSLGNPAATSTWVSSVGGITDRKERPHSSMGHTLDKDPSLSPIRHAEHGRSRGYSADDMSLDVTSSPIRPALKKTQRFPPTPSKEKRHLPDVKQTKSLEELPPKDATANDSDWSKPLGTSLTSNFSMPRGSTYYDDVSLSKPSDREVAVRTKMIEAKFHEEKLKLQQRHDAAVQKIIDRKNTEIEDMKAHFKSKSKETEEIINKLERKVQTLVKETEHIRENKDRQISELKAMADESNESRRTEFEKRLHDVMNEFEQEKFELQKQHTQNIQEILDDTNSRLQRMEAEYSQQTTSTTNVIKELESRVQQLMTEVDSTLSQRSAVEKEKNEALMKYEKLGADHDRLKERLSQMEKEHGIALESHEHELRTLKNKTEASLEFLKQEHAMAASKASDTISELEDKVDQLKKSLKDTEEHRHRQVRELEQGHQQDKVHLENLHDKQIRNLKKEMEQMDSNWSTKLAKADQHIKDKEQDILRLKEQKQQQALQSEQALEEFKGQVEKNQNRIYDDMKQQMQRVENDLQKSKQAREKQGKEFSRQLEEEKYKHQHEMAEAKVALEGEKSHMLRELHVQKEFMLSENDREMENLRESHKLEIQSLEARLRERNDRAEKSQTDSERVIRELREELVQANQLRKQQLVELGLLREEEKQKMTRDHEAELSRQRGEAEQQKLELQKSHSAEMEKVMEKTNERLKNIEKEYAERGQKSSESMAELQAIVTQLRGDIKRSRDSSDEKLAELKQQYEDEKQNLRKQYSQNLGTIQREVESQRNRVRSLELKLHQQDSDYDEKTTQLKLQFEQKIRGLLPADLKQELEDTISSLRSQVSSLQQRSVLLQEELDTSKGHQHNGISSFTSPPITSAV